MIILKTKNYKKSITSLSKKDKVLLYAQEKLLVKNIFDPKLHTKKLNGFPDEHVYSFRITPAKHVWQVYFIQKYLLFLLPIDVSLYSASLSLL
jgi:hypothetical protein